MRKLWQDEAWEEYLYWQIQDKSIEKTMSFERKGINKEIKKMSAMHAHF